MSTISKQQQQQQQHYYDHNAKIISPSISSGFARRKEAIISGLIFLTIVYGCVYILSKDSEFLKPAEQFCTDHHSDQQNDGTIEIQHEQQQQQQHCTRPDLFGFQVASGIMQIFMGVSGFLAWHWTKRAHTYTSTPEGRLFGYLEDADRLNAGIFVFQLWDFLVSLWIPEHATGVFLTHHILAATTAWFSLEYQMVHHYAIFFGGCSEISSIFLVICDFDVYFPSAKSTIPFWGTIVFACQASFTIAFFYYRIVGWWTVSYQLWKDVAYVTHRNHQGGKKATTTTTTTATVDNNCNMTIAEQYRPGKVWWFIYVFLLMDLLLGLLQVYWFGFGIIPKILEILN